MDKTWQQACMLKAFSTGLFPSEDPRIDVLFEAKAKKAALQAVADY